jgi:hypothetical protein
MARYVVEASPDTLSLADLELVVSQREELNFELVSLAAGTVQGARANLLTFARRPVAPTVVLQIVDGQLDANQQTAKIADAAGDARRLVSYSAVWVAGTLQNVAAFRLP